MNLPTDKNDHDSMLRLTTLSALKPDLRLRALEWFNGLSVDDRFNIIKCHYGSRVILEMAEENNAGDRALLLRICNCNNEYTDEFWEFEDAATDACRGISRHQHNYGSGSESSGYNTNSSCVSSAYGCDPSDRERVKDFFDRFNYHKLYALTSMHTILNKINRIYNPTDPKRGKVFVKFINDVSYWQDKKPYVKVNVITNEKMKLDYCERFLQVFIDNKNKNSLEADIFNITLDKVDENAYHTSKYAIELLGTPDALYNVCNSTFSEWMDTIVNLDPCYLMENAV